MKKTLISIAAMATCMGVCAQSSVTIFGVVDAAVTYGSASGAGSSSRKSLSSGNYATSRLGFRGTEDLGGGMAASFWLEGQIMNDDGTAGRELAPQNQSNSPTARGQGFNFSRRATVSLSSGIGELRAGRDFVPTNYNLSAFDPFGNVGVGTSLVLLAPTTGLTAGGDYNFQPAGQGTNGILVRASNIVSYFLPPNLGGFYGQASYWFGENVQNGATNQKDGSGAGGRVGYQTGPLNIAAAYISTNYRGTPVATTAVAQTGDLTSFNFGGSWDFGVARVMGTYVQDKRESSVQAKGTGYQIGAMAPYGLHEFRVSYSNYKIEAGTTADPRAGLLALGYAYNLSKRTNVYVTAARVANKNGSRVALGGAGIGSAVNNSKVTGLDFGIRHSF